MTARGTIQRRLDPAERYGLRTTLFAVALLLVALPFGFLLEQVVHNKVLTRLDTSAANHLHHAVRDSPGAVSALRAVTFLGSTIWLTTVVVLAAAYLLRLRRRRLAVFVVVTTAAGSLLNFVVKQVVSRPRPSLVDPVATASGKSFPSGHTMGSTVVYGTLVLVFIAAVRRPRRGLVVVAVTALVVAIGFTRLALGVHYVTDVVGGLILGAAWLSASTAAFSIWREERGRPAVDAAAGVEPEAGADLRRGRPASGVGA